jgi:hypothetical protein
MGQEWQKDSMTAKTWRSDATGLSGPLVSLGCMASDEPYPWQPGYVLPERPGAGADEDQPDPWLSDPWDIEGDDGPLMRPPPPWRPVIS